MMLPCDPDWTVKQKKKEEDDPLADLAKQILDDREKDKKKKK